MHPYTRTILGMALLALLMIPFAHALTGLYSQTMTWNILANRSHSITYGGSCSETSFYFNEIDANYDPDNDGNAARIAPSSIARTLGTTTAQRDYNFVGVTAPSSTNIGYLGEVGVSPPTTIVPVSTEFTDDEYTNAIAADSAGVQTISTGGQYPSFKITYKSVVLPEKTTALSFHFVGVNIHNAICDVEPTAPESEGIEGDINFFLWNFQESEYERIGRHTGTGVEGTYPVENVDQTYFVDFNLTRFIHATDRNITLLIQGSSDASVFSCLYGDIIEMYQQYYYDNNVFCQSATIAPFTIYNNGNTDINVDGNFSSAFSGNDTNLVLKVWQGTGSGCGTAGMGGWEKDCSVTNPQTDLGTSTCRQYNQSNATTAGRLVSNLGTGDSNQLCMSGDINTYVAGGTHAKEFVTNDRNAT
ncbi:MAG: hypothetical protein IPJ89_00940 [Candidatus Iainarchaeum archaeon]|uniref:Uncharacterized protein n=1 Tax=Candidatus Iainarchaeum sp. TaxID=3101447 RepID=A0A7T9DK37_9ARCH|nr:MAG: hypothetical protein IPJ89_00940 [Candidatus Diapherotrites archaeon]